MVYNSNHLRIAYSANLYFLSSVPAPVTDVVLMFDEATVTNSDGGTVHLSISVSWTASSMPNGNIILLTVTIRTESGSTLFTDNTLGVSATSLTVVQSVAPAEMYFATVEITNGAGSSEANSSLVQSPQGGKCA